MKQKKTSAKAAVVILIGLVLVGIAAIAAEYGTSADPLVSQSYIDSVFRPQLLSQVDSQINQKLSAASSQIQSAQDVIDQKIAEFESRQLSVNVDQTFMNNVSSRVIQSVSDQSVNNSTFKTVTLTTGKTMILSVGAELVLQSGTATGENTLVDTTTGGALSTGGAVQPYHLYLATAQGSGIRASSAVTLLVRGTYQVQ